MGIKLTEKKFKTELKNLIRNSSIGSKDKEIWYNFIDKINEELAITLLQAISDDKKNLIFLNTNLVSKSSALSSQDQDTWSKIIEEEKKYLVKYK